MKLSSISIIPLFIILQGNINTTITQGDNIEFICLKKQMAAKQCHYNFKVDGAKYRFVDIGCRFAKKEEVIEKVKDGSLALAREWKIECAEVKEKKEGSGY